MDGADIWIGLADVVPADPLEDDIGGAFGHVLAAADDEAGFRSAVAKALSERGLRLVEIDDAERVRERLRSGSVAPELIELALDAALEGSVQVGDLYAYPAEDEEEPDNADELRTALESRELVNLRGPEEYHDTIGCVSAVGSQWALIQIVDACGEPDGFRAFRLGTIPALEPVDAGSSFLPRLLEARPLTSPAPEVGLDDARELLRAASQLSTLIYLVIGDMEPGAFWIGQISALDDDDVLVEKVSALGTWAGAERYRYDAITRVGFGGAYEAALAVAAGAVTGG